MYENEFKRMKKGEHHVEVLCPLDERILKYIEQFRNEHPNTSTEWFNHRFNEKISLNEVVELLDGIPKLEEQVTVLSEGCITYYPIGKDPIQSFRSAIVEQVPCELSERGPLFFKMDVINWMQKKAEIDRMFVFRLNSDFIEDYVQRHSLLVVKNEEISKEKFFNLLAKDILEDIISINLEEMRNMPFIIKACLKFCGFELSKDRKIYNRKDEIVLKLSYDALRIYLKNVNLPLGKQGNLSKTHKDNIEKGLNYLKTERFCLDKYNVHKMRLKKLIKQGMLN